MTIIKKKNLDWLIISESHLKADQPCESSKHVDYGRQTQLEGVEPAGDDTLQVQTHDIMQTLVVFEKLAVTEDEDVKHSLEDESRTNVVISIK